MVLDGFYFGIGLFGAALVAWSVVGFIVTIFKE